MPPAWDRTFLDVRRTASRASPCACRRCASPIRPSTPRRTCARSSAAHDAGAHYARLSRARAERPTPAATCSSRSRCCAACCAALAPRRRRRPPSWNLVALGRRAAGGRRRCSSTAPSRSIAAVPSRSRRRRIRPNYREFYELRWFQPAADARAARPSRLLGDDVPFGTDVLVRAAAPARASCCTPTSARTCGCRCRPSTLAALAGATVLANLSASNVTVGKWEYRQRPGARVVGATNLAVQLYSAAGFGESTADLAWDGHGLIAERGELVAETERFALGGTQRRRRRRPAGARAGPHAPDVVRRTTRATHARADAASSTCRAGAERAPGARRWHALRAPRRPASVRARRSGGARRSAAARSSSSRRPRWRAGSLRCRPTRAASSSASRAGRTRRTRCWSRCTRSTCSGCRARDVVGVTMPGFGTSDRTYATPRALIARARRHAARDRRSRRSARRVFAAIGHDAASRGPHLRERAGLDCARCCCSPSRRRSAASTSAPATSPSWRSAGRHLRRRPHVALRRQRRRAEDADRPS